MSLRVGAGSGRVHLPGLPAGGVVGPRSTWPTRRPVPLPLSSRGAPLLAAAMRPALTLRDREQLSEQRLLGGRVVGSVGALLPLAHGTGARTWRPTPVDRGWREGYYIPRQPGPATSGGETPADKKAGDVGGCTDCG